jgi:hypothetical protein
MKRRGVKVTGFVLCAGAYYELVVAGSTFDGKCYFCQTPLALSPSGRRRLADPQNKPICTVCLHQRMKKDHQFIDMGSTAENEEIRAQELRSIGPNLWRTRN